MLWLVFIFSILAFAAFLFGCGTAFLVYAMLASDEREHDDDTDLI